MPWLGAYLTYYCHIKALIHRRRIACLNAEGVSLLEENDKDMHRELVRALNAHKNSI
jgi:hypothetical protein